jgi:glycosyltransferase involved in cell wall biosynthesis
MTPGRRLLCLFPWLVMGGADRFNLELLRALRERGWSPAVVTTLPSPNPWRPAFEALAPVSDLGALPAAERPARLLAAAADADVALLAGSWLAYDLLPALRAARPELAIADYTHMEQPEWRDGGYPRASLDRAAHLDLQIVASEHLRRWMLARGGDPARVQVCHINVDTAAWDPARFDRAALRVCLGLAPDDLAVLFAGRLEAQKRPDVLAAVAAAVCRREPRARFLIAGDGSYAGFLRAALRRRGLAGRARLLGPVDSDGVRELLAAADLFLLPSAHEGIALAIYEAMAMAVPPVGAAVGGQAELVSPECGVLLPPGAPAAAYAAAILDLARDRARLRAMGERARARVVARFPLPAMGERIDALLARAAALHREQPRPPVPPAAAAAAVRAAVQSAAAHDDAEMAYHSARGPKGAARTLYRRLVAAGAWWLVPLAERIRQPR